MSDRPPRFTERVPFKNTSGETAPAFGLLAITGSVSEGGTLFLLADKPGTTLCRQIAVNGEFDVPPGHKGMCLRAGDQRFLYAGDPPLAGQSWGPKAGQWAAARGYPGLVAQGLIDADIHLAHGTHERPRRIDGKPIAEIAAATGATPGSGSVRLWIDAGAGMIASDLTFTALNLAPHPLRAGRLVKFSLFGDSWIADPVENLVHHVMLAAGIAAGASGSVTLPSGETVSATNWSGVNFESGDKVTAYLDLTNNTWYLIKSGGGEPGEPSDGIRWFRANLNGDLCEDDATAELDFVEALDGGSAPSAPTAMNSFGLWGDDNDFALIAECPGLTGADYLLVQVKQRRSSEILQGTLSGTTASDTNPASVVVDGGTVSASNPLGLAGPNDAACFVVRRGGCGSVTYELLNVQHYEREYLEDANWDSPDLTKTKRRILAVDGGPADAPENILTATETIVAVEILDDGMDMTYIYRNVWVFEADTLSAPQILNEGIECPEDA